ncbi:ribosomal protein S18-alanine N-acetyltransferase [Pseudoramibacter faecis]|uniref:ribosomal protein S18-alanine N-acetyltransferase n=1 Tax=Pseudoramibacter faecis TaxID=3108534 RepID=UPI002E76FD8F|nr:ribosomal protein S18-alanine N-acetyltransferase [Pseudoramibacter sp. HA2172]
MADEVLSPSSFGLRPMIRADIAQVLTIDRDAGLVPWKEASFFQEIKNPLAHYVIIEHSSGQEQALQVVGFAGEWCVADEAQIMKVAVLPDWQQRGLGRRLMKTMMDYARLNGCTEMTLEVRQKNHQALKLYRHLGFEIIGKRERYYPDGSNAYLMSVPL